MKERNYDDAIPAFRAFIKQYPDSVYAANANYWLGSYYLIERICEAKQAFKTVVDRFGDSNKRGDSLVRIWHDRRKPVTRLGRRNTTNKSSKITQTAQQRGIAQQQLAAIKRN